ncbi:AGE family epimerase/isomerase [candidate division KSB1 bacterium]|nr:AGE family epimerase/isomerase [candidate division KSB1 bacterium]
MTKIIDHENGGFYGAMTNDLHIHNNEPRSSTLCARILWTFAMAYRRLGNPEYLDMATRMHDYLLDVFVDKQYGGVYWTVDKTGIPVMDRKHHYAQSFAIYGLTEYYRSTNRPVALELAKELFYLLEKHAYNPIHKGYIEGSSRDWQKLDDMRLSDRDLNCRKSMNTLLHTLEGYTNLMHVWDDARLKAQHRDLIELFLQHVIHPGTYHLKLFFDDHWNSLSENISFGHDIEASWLLVEAADVQNEPVLLKRVQDIAIKIADAVHNEGFDDDGALLYESGPNGIVEDTKDWWVQAEAMVGFYNAFQISGQEYFANDMMGCWNFIREYMIDHTHGDWVKRLHRDRSVDHTRFKTGPWDCPYHHSRMCFEMLERLVK